MPQAPLPIQKTKVFHILGYSRADRIGLKTSLRRSCRGLDRALKITKQTPAGRTRAVIALETPHMPL